MDISSVYNNQIDIQSLLAGNTNGINRVSGNNFVNEPANYAQKGEPMYMVEMDTDEDGTVTLDEFKEYCQSKGIKTRDMVKMSQLASSYRIMRAEGDAIDYISKLIPNVFPKLKQSESESGYLRQGENQYNISNDPNNDQKVSYEEYMEYCQQNVVPNEMNANTKIEESEDGNLKISSSGKALESYKNNEGSFLTSTFEEFV